MTITVYTVVTGARSLLRPVYVERTHPIHRLEFVCFTDDPSQHVDGWTMVKLDGGGLSPQRTSRLPKILAHRYLNTYASIYHDASFTLTTPPHELVASALRGANIAMHAHPCRKCLYEECDVLIREQIGTPSLVAVQRGKYIRDGMPPDFGLWAAGLIVRRHSTDVAILEQEWWNQFINGCERDQVALPMAAHITQTHIATIPGNVYLSPHTHYHGHNKQAPDPYANLRDDARQE